MQNLEQDLSQRAGILAAFAASIALLADKNQRI
jgi:hypothetical protein